MIRVSMLRSWCLVLALLTVPLSACRPPSAADAPLKPVNAEIILATTTSTQDSGLLHLLVPWFERRSGYRVKTISVGTGQALMLGARGEADVVLVHAPATELDWMAAGNGSRRVLVMHNDFVVVGPADDPASLRLQSTTEAGFTRIAQGQTLFISRGDESGTHQKELDQWRSSGIAPKGLPWYQEVGQGMGATLTIANEKGAYTLTDRGTFLARRGTVELEIVLEGMPGLLNVYHVMPVSSSKFPSVNAAGAEAFADFLVSPEIQAAIRTFGVDRFGEPLFFPDAGRPEEELGG